MNTWAYPSTSVHVVLNFHFVNKRVDLSLMRDELVNGLLQPLLFLTSTALVLFLKNAFGFMAVTAAAILLLTASYAIKYWREEVGTGLAYFGLTYIGFGLALLGIGLMQSHAGCTFLIGDCYQQSLPSYWLEFKLVVNLGLTMINGLAITFVCLNLRRS